MAYSLRLSLSVAITQMVPPPIFNSVNLTNVNGELEIICPFNDSNYIHEHFDYGAIFDSLYSVIIFNQFQSVIIVIAYCLLPIALCVQYFNIASLASGGKHHFSSLKINAMAMKLSSHMYGLADSM